MKVEAVDVVSLLGSWAHGSAPLYVELADGLQALIESGSLRDGALLPPERSLAADLSVSRGTVVNAYGVLAERAMVSRRQGSGTRVMTQETPGPPRQHRATALFDRSASTALLKAVPRSLLDLPAELRTMADAGVSSDVDLAPEGLWNLRELVAEHVVASGLATVPDQILITSGTQHACSLTVRALCGPGDVVLTEQLTWPGLTDAVVGAGARVFGVRMDDHGIDVDELRAAVERLRPAAVYLNPHHHNPTGTRLAPDRRAAVADIAADYGIPLVEDRAYAPLAFDGDVPAPLASHRPDGPLIVIESVSKIIWDGLRVGWVRASADLIGRLRLIRAVDDLGTAIPSQLLAEQLMPRYPDFLAARVSELRDKADRAYAAVTETIPEWRVSPALGGGSLWAGLPRGSARAFAAHAARLGVLLVTDASFSAGEPDDTSVRLPFTAPIEVFREAIDQLAEAWATFEPSRRPAPTGIETLVV